MGSASAPRFRTARPGPVGHVAAHVVTTYTSAQVGSHRIWFLIVPARWTPRQASVLRLAPPPPPHHRFLLSAFVVSCSKLRAPRNTACCANARGSPELQHACSLTDGQRVRLPSTPPSSTSHPEARHLFRHHVGGACSAAASSLSSTRRRRAFTLSCCRGARIPLGHGLARSYIITAHRFLPLSGHVGLGPCPMWP